ncbi:hypothetical protein EYC80_001945 [Monilinia laxa]|uniref:PLD phosphodiesterase domain-containing protein n=1 Tax=Monilinia laxa TaxID=61186 RepID=A0A5N6K6I5_MONLA|nr:hypothetical protein EYC80_001945 [Monilinia laxa]
MGIPEIMGMAEMAGRSLQGPIEMGNIDASLLASVDLSHLPPNTETLLLPHTHSSYSPFSVFFHPNTNTPSTPLNTFLLSRISTAKSSITIYTPNLTYTPLINALFEALSRGINVRITVSKKLMILEQIVTAGTVTEWEIWKMRRRYRKLRTRLRKKTEDLETGNTRVGNLDIIYFDPANVLVNDGNDANERSEGAVHVAAGLESIGKESRPVKLHLKMTIIDGEITVLGSGNMDRASWVTSQELGVAIFSEQVSRSLGEVAKTVYG